MLAKLFLSNSFGHVYINIYQNCGTFCLLELNLQKENLYKIGAIQTSMNAKNLIHVKTCYFSKQKKKFRKHIENTKLYPFSNRGKHSIFYHKKLLKEH